MRIFQALVGAAAARSRSRHRGADPSVVFGWLERCAVPVLVAPAGWQVGQPLRIAVPNNDLDLVWTAWAKGTQPSRQPNELKTMKAVCTIQWTDGETVSYLWTLPEPITDEVRGHVDAICAIARSVVALGWGIDMVVAHGALISDQEAAALPGERWLPSGGGGANTLRVPKAGTLQDLVKRHERFLNRLQQDEEGRTTFAAPPPLTVFDVVGYRRATDSQPRAAASFALLKIDGTRFCPFDTARRALSVAGMVRHATKAAAKSAGRPSTWIDTFVLGHGETVGAADHKAVGPERFAYVPLPSIESRGGGPASHVGNVRRVMLTCMTPGHDEEIAWARRTLSGHDLVDEKSKEPIALLRLLPESDRMLQHYLGSAPTWATVTPVVLPGFDDPHHYRRRLNKGTNADEQKRLLARLAERIDGLLRKAIIQAGLPAMLADHASLDWRKVGFWPGTELADRYGVPDHLKRFPRVHVKVTWRDVNGNPIPISGPICLGGGRFYGLGLFAALPNSQ
jgi:CRISPR-associated protein Csb2